MVDESLLRLRKDMALTISYIKVAETSICIKRILGKLVFNF